MILHDAIPSVIRVAPKRRLVEKRIISVDRLKRRGMPPPPLKEESSPFAIYDPVKRGKELHRHLTEERKRIPYF